MDRSFHVSGSRRRAAPWHIRTMALRQLERTLYQEKATARRVVVYVVALKVLMHGIFITVRYQSFTLDANIAGQNRRVKKCLMLCNSV